MTISKVLLQDVSCKTKKNVHYFPQISFLQSIAHRPLRLTLNNSSVNKEEQIIIKIL
jgi:hypothetical protein